MSATTQFPPPLSRAGDLNREEFARDMADLLWSHGFTRHHARLIIIKWCGGRKDVEQLAIDHLEELPWDHHEQLELPE